MGDAQNTGSRTNLPAQIPRSAWYELQHPSPGSFLTDAEFAFTAPARARRGQRLNGGCSTAQLRLEV